MSYVPQLVSERQPQGHWDRCLESSFSMLSDKMSLGTQVLDPRKLEAAIPGAANGSNVAENIAAIAKVYPNFPVAEIKPTRSTDTMEVLLLGGKGFAIVGNYHDIPLHYQRWDPAFAATNPAGHATYIQVDGPAGRRWSLRDGKYVWWMDPLATPDYPGEWMELATMFAFLNGNTNAYGGEGTAVATGGGPAHPIGGNPVLAITSQVAGFCTLTVGKQLYDLNAKPLERVSGGGIVPSPFASGGFRAVEVTVGPTLQLVLIKTTDTTFVPGTTTDCSAAVAAATAPLNARITAAKTALG